MARCFLLISGTQILCLIKSWSKTKWIKQVKVKSEAPEYPQHFAVWQGIAGWSRQSEICFPNHILLSNHPVGDLQGHPSQVMSCLPSSALPRGFTKCPQSSYGPPTSCPFSQHPAESLQTGQPWVRRRQNLQIFVESLSYPRNQTEMSKKRQE